MDSNCVLGDFDEVSELKKIASMKLLRGLDPLKESESPQNTKVTTEKFENQYVAYIRSTKSIGRDFEGFWSHQQILEISTQRKMLRNSTNRSDRCMLVTSSTD